MPLIHAIGSAVIAAIATLHTTVNIGFTSHIIVIVVGHWHCWPLVINMAGLALLRHCHWSLPLAIITGQLVRHWYMAVIGIRH